MTCDDECLVRLPANTARSASPSSPCSSVGKVPAGLRSISANGPLSSVVGGTVRCGVNVLQTRERDFCEWLLKSKHTNYTKYVCERGKLILFRCHCCRPFYT
jgi:hypothetical protein